MWAFDDKSNNEAVCIAHNGNTYDSHFILSYLVVNTEYPELLANGGNILQMYIKTCESKFIDSCCFLSMPLSKFSDTFNLPDVVKGAFPHCFNTPNNYGYVDLLPDLHYYEPNGLKEAARSKLIQWHSEHSNDEFIFDCEIHEYCTADVALLKYDYMKFRVSFLADTVFRTSQQKENTIAWVPSNGYKSMRNYSNKSMGWITYCEKITGVRYKHAWYGGEMHMMMPTCGQTHNMSMDIINGSVPSLDVRTTIAPRVTTSRLSTPCPRPWVTCIVKRKDGSNV